MKNYKRKKGILILTILVAALAALCLSGCPGEPADNSIGAITIYNIPATITLMGNSDVTFPAAKIILSASDYESENMPSKAQGWELFKPEMLENEGAYAGTYRVTLDLKKPIVNLKNLPNGTPNPNYDPNLNANYDDGNFYGTAVFYSVVLSPNFTEAPANSYREADGENAILVMAGFTLNKGIAELNWEKINFNFRYEIESDSKWAETFQFGTKLTAIYTDIIQNDYDVFRYEPYP